MIRNKFSICALMLISVATYSQKVTVSEQNEKIKTETASVYATSLEGKPEEVNTAWIKFLKDIGKVRQGADMITVSDPVLNGTPFSKKALYASAKESGNTTALWAGILESEWDAKDVNYANREIGKLVYQFGIKYYRDKVQKQIDEAQQALDAVEKQQQRLLNQNKDLTIKLSNNDQEKIQLEKSLEANKLEHSVLLQKIENNKKAQDSIANANVQIKKVMELHKDRMRQIN